MAAQADLQGWGGSCVAGDGNVQACCPRQRWHEAHDEAMFQLDAAAHVPPPGCGDRAGAGMSSAVPALRCFSGAELRPHLQAVADLRIAVFREWPYLYDGDAAYEADYLQAYLRSPCSLFVLAFDGDRVVGASTAVPLVDETEAFRGPVAAHGIDPGQVFYFGESVLLPEWRGRGLGHRFFDEREAFARRRPGVRSSAFCAVQRDLGDPRRPPGYRPLDAFWRGRGYAPVEGLTATLDWKETWHEAPGSHLLQFWMRAL